MSAPKEKRLTLTEAATLEQRRIADLEPPPLYLPHSQLKPIDPLAAKVPTSPKGTPVSEWDTQKLKNVDDRFDAFWAEEDAKVEAETVRKAAETARLEAEATKQEAERTKFTRWGIIRPVDLLHLPEGVFTFKQVLILDWCRYSREKWFIKSFLRQFGYPEDLITLKVITRIGYNELIKIEKDFIRTRNTQTVQAKREKQASPVDPLPEPNQRQSLPKSKPSKRKNKKLSQ